jgi:hypothetical protein
LEVSHVRNQLRQAIDAARQRAQGRRERSTEAQRAFEAFLTLATPVLRHLSHALRAEGLAFTLFTPEGALRLASDRSRVDFIELLLDRDADQPGVKARISYSRGSRTVDEERLLKPGIPADSVTEDELLAFMLDLLAPWLEK